MGVSAIPYSEYLAFFNLLGVEVQPYELEILEVFDGIALRHYSKQQEKEQKSASKKK